jgi:hypothetical protein
MIGSIAKTTPPARDGHPISCRLYELLLLAYPAEFRKEFGAPMAQLFRDCYRVERCRGSFVSIAGLWLRTILDTVESAPQEHLDNLRREKRLMKNLKNDLIALLGCVGIIALALVLLGYGRKHEVSSILIFGHTLDAVVTTGIVGNLIVFLLVKTTKISSLQIALWTFLVINVALFALAAIIGGRVDSQFSLGNLLIGYVASFIFWVGLHWIWARSGNKTQIAT